MEWLRKKIRDRAVEITNFKEKEMIPLTDEEQKVCHICKKKKKITDKKDKSTFKLYHKVRDHCHYTGKFRGAAHSICNLRFKIRKEIPIVAHHATHDYHFIIKQLAKEFDGQFECLGENTEKYVTFSVPIKYALNNGKKIKYKLKFFDNFRFMSTSLPSLLDKLHSKKNVKDEWKEEKSSQNVILLGLKIINYTTNVKNVKKDG